MLVSPVDARRPHRQDTYDLRDQMLSDQQHHQQPDQVISYTSDEEHSVLEDDSTDEGDHGEYMEDDESSELSVPDESINFDLVYSLTNFAATVEGQASVVKGDSLFLMDDSNSYWWLVRVLKTQEVGYIPAENIETPFERLARLNKHRNVDLAAPTALEKEGVDPTDLRAQQSSRASAVSPTAPPNQRSDSRIGTSAAQLISKVRSRSRTRSVNFTHNSTIFRYPPAVWNEEEEITIGPGGSGVEGRGSLDGGEEEWDEEEVEYLESVIRDEEEDDREGDVDGDGYVDAMDVALSGVGGHGGDDLMGMEPDDGMHWEEGAVEEMQTRAIAQRQAQQQLQLRGKGPTALSITPANSSDNGIRQDSKLSPLQQQQQQAMLRLHTQTDNQASPVENNPHTVRLQTSRERLLATAQDRQQASPSSATSTNSPASPGKSQVIMDPAQVRETKRLVVTPPVARDGTSPTTPTGPLSASSTSSTYSSGGHGQNQGPLLPSAILEQQAQQREIERKRAIEEIEAAEEANGRKRVHLVGAFNNANGKERDLSHKSSVETRSSITSTSEGTTTINEKGSGSSSGSGGAGGGGKLRKEKRVEEDNGKKKKSGVFGGLFPWKKDKDKDKEKNGKDKGIINVTSGANDRDSAASDMAGFVGGRSSVESGRSSTPSHIARDLGVMSPTGDAGRSQQRIRGVVSPPPANLISPNPSFASPLLSSVTSSPSQPSDSPVISQQQQQQQPHSALQQVSAHASQLREHDQQQRALYQQYLKRSPASPPDQPSLGLWSESAALNPNTSATASPKSAQSLTLPSPSSAPGSAVSTTGSTPHRARPGSLIISPAGGPDGHGVAVPELSVMRVFAGQNLHSEATFKTVLLNSSTTARELISQAIQRFRLSTGEDQSEFYLTVKQVQGSSTVLLPEETPLLVFEQLVETSLEVPRIKRSSVGSISSVASNLSQHPAIRNLPMNDFTDDSAFKLYLNRKGGEHMRHDSGILDDEDTILADGVDGDDADSSITMRGQFLSVDSSGNLSVSPERFSSPSFRFALQLVIYPTELPDDMIFDPHTEAILFRETLRDRPSAGIVASPGISQTQRRKVFIFPKNITVAEVIEVGLERFGILEGVVDGGDEVEDKLTKRKSMSRVRYILTVQIEGLERELSPASKVIDAYPRPPAYRRSKELKRRSIDSAQLLGSIEDIQSDDPVFILHRAVSYRSTARHRLSAPLDEIALSQLHRVSGSSSSAVSDASTVPASEETATHQPSRQEIIAAQRLASRANQKAIVSAQINSHRGVDVVLPDKGLLRSSRYDLDNKMRYSYVQPDGETYDISDIIEEELKADENQRKRSLASSPADRNDDLLQGVVNGSDADLLTRVLNKINGKSGVNGKVEPSIPPSGSEATVSSVYSSSSVYSESEGTQATRSSSESRSNTPTANRRYQSSPEAVGPDSRPYPTRGATLPIQIPPIHRSQPSFTSVMTDSSYRTAATSTPTPMGTASSLATTPTPTKSHGSDASQNRIPLVWDDVGISDMLSIIDIKAALQRKQKPSPPLEYDPVEEMLFGPQVDLKTLHPQIQEIYKDTFKKLEEMDNALDDLLQKTMHLF